MHYLIKIIFFLLISYHSFANENKTNQILFKINDKVFTNIDLENRREYVALINNLNPLELTTSEKKEIYNDYISALIFHEFYIKNKIVFKDIKDEVNLIYKKTDKQLEEIEIKNFKFNIFIDLIRNKIIQEKLNSKKNSLFQEVNKLDLLYNYNLQYIIIKEKLIDKELVTKINDRKKFDNFKNFLEKNKIDFFYKEEDINDYEIISNKVKNIINKNIKIYLNNENGFMNLISIQKNLESYEGIFVKLINFKSSKPFKKKDLQCDRINQIIDTDKTVFKEYEYSKLNNNIKNNLKSIDDFIIFEDNNEYNYIILCGLTYDEDLLKNINFNKNVNSLVNKIQNNFLKKYKNEYKYTEIK